VALNIAEALEASGYSSWYYERDSVPGPSYLLQTSGAIEASQAVVVLISPHSLGSHQVTKEVVRAHEAGKPFIPVLISVSHVEFAARQPEWREAIGSATSVALPRGGVAAVLPRIIGGVRALGIEPSKHDAAQLQGAGTYRAVGVVAQKPSPLARLAALPLWQKIGIVALVAAAAAAVAVATLAGDGDPGATDLEDSGNGSPAAVADAETTPLQTSFGPVRIAEARFAPEICPPAGFPGACDQPPESKTFLVLTLEGWDGEGIIIGGISIQAGQSYITYQADRAPIGPHSYLDETGGVVRSGYTIPISAMDRSLELVWPENPRFPLRPERG
jgi:hypothetical protein